MRKAFKPFLPLHNIQFFADSSDQGDQQADNQAGGDQQQDQTQTGTDSQQSEEKTFKQEDVNNIVAKESKKATEKLLKELGIDDFENAKDGLTKFKDWQDSQKTEAQKQQDKLATLEGEKKTLSSENQQLKAQISAMKAGVKADSVEDVIALSERLVNEDTSMDEAIKQVIEKYPQFASVQEEESQSTPSIVTPGNPNGGKSQGNNDPFEAKLAKYN